MQAHEIIQHDTEHKPFDVKCQRQSLIRGKVKNTQFDDVWRYFYSYKKSMLRAHMTWYEVGDKAKKLEALVGSGWLPLL